MSVLLATFRGSPIWAIALTLLVPAFITYLSLYPQTRAVRAGLLPIAVGAMWVMLRTYEVVRRESISSD